MNDFSTIRRAKEYLIGQIVAEAAREGIELSELERKMLYFSESGWTLPNMLKVNEEFEREYDSDEYEQKIAAVIRGIQSRQDRTQNDVETWDNAVRKLSEEDQYLLVLIDLAGATKGGASRWLPSLNANPSKRPQGDVFRLIVAAVVLSVVLFTVMLLRAMLFH